MNSYVNWWGEGPTPSVHSEEAAIKQCKNIDLSSAVLYVSRVNKSGDEMYSRPCSKCLNLINSVGIRKVVYTAGDGSYEGYP